mmetsp:Transcript_53504/g.142163  ORF Transcript_53504/g.142163 Transcript_53504/m.142163 type:complete len:307 (-) Transcript_53504:888-1808(-)
MRSSGVEGLTDSRDLPLALSPLKHLLLHWRTSPLQARRQRKLSGLHAVPLPVHAVVPQLHGVALGAPQDYTADLGDQIHPTRELLSHIRVLRRPCTPRLFSQVATAAHADVAQGLGLLDVSLAPDLRRQTLEPRPVLQAREHLGNKGFHIARILTHKSPHSRLAQLVKNRPRLLQPRSLRVPRVELSHIPGRETKRQQQISESWAAHGVRQNRQIAGAQPIVQVPQQGGHRIFALVVRIGGDCLKHHAPLMCVRSDQKNALPFQIGMNPACVWTNPPALAQHTECEARRRTAVPGCSLGDPQILQE